MKRQLSELSNQRYDLAVIGAGIHGAAIAAMAASCGLSVVLLEKGDFCSRTSANSLKILHGGLRYLQHLDVPRILDSIASRRWVMANFPEIVEPLECILLTSGHGFRSKQGMAVGLAVNDLFSLFRNRGVRLDKHLGRGRTLPFEKCQQIIPGLARDHWTGGALWFDALATNTERVVLTLIHNLVDGGGAAANYVEVKRILCPHGKVTGVLCHDHQAHQDIEIQADMVVNATGAGVAQYAEDKIPQESISGWSKAVNLVLNRRFFGKYAVGLEGTSSFVDKDALVQKGKRLFFFVPWREKTMVGTVYTHVENVDKGADLSREEIEAILSEINQIYPAAQLQLRDVINYHAGFVPCIKGRHQGHFDVQLDKRETVLDHGAEGGVEGLYSIKTVKFTTAYTLCRDFLQRLQAKDKISKQIWKDRSRSEFVLSGEGGSLEQIPEWLVLRWGRSATEVARRLPREILEDVNAGHVLTTEEIKYAVEEEMALHLDDLLFRRTGLATIGLPEEDILQKACVEMGALLGWDDATCLAERGRVTHHFHPLENMQEEQA
ncbi:FAD-dependent oxidoreductase [Desulfogranum japonicum]|uniref:FAD-dependent oxidoreductase n=1 Tax=Desulfogranum japonicum TaxID=231447 RepID=UPI0003F6E893|nr:FAD-dependent oxidoreductase [Desulfogranum japonicum]